jgi:hypothetical protein
MPRYEVRWWETVQRHKAVEVEAEDARQTAELIESGRYDHTAERVLGVDMVFQFPEEPLLLDEEG